MSWERIAVAEAFDFVRNGKSIKQTKDVDGLPITRIETIAERRVDPDRVGYAGLVESGNEQWLLQRGDILFSHINSVDHIGKCAIYEGIPEKLIHGMNLLALRPNKRLHPKFAFYALNHANFRARLLPFVNKAVNQASVSTTNLKTLEIPLPPLDEQKRIAVILDKADALRAKRRQAIALLDRLTQSIFLEMFGDIIESMKQSSSAQTVADVGRVQLGRQRAPKYQTGKFTRPYVRVANIYEDRIDLSDVLSMDFNDRDFKDYKLERGDILLNEGQSTELVGRPAMWRDEIPDCCFQNTLVRFQPDRRKLIPEFALAVFLHYFRNGEFSKISSKTSSVAHLGASRFSRMPFPLPSLTEQEMFVGRAKLVRKTKAAVELANADSLFASLQHRAFTGKL